MTPTAPHVIHVVGHDTPAGRLATLQALRSAPSVAATQSVVVYGHSTPVLEQLKPAYRAYPPRVADFADWFRRSRCNDARPILHVWSPSAIGRVASNDEVSVTPPTLLDLEFPADPRRRVADAGEEPNCMVPTAAMAEFALAAGIRPDRCAVVRDSIDFGELRAADRTRARDRLHLSADAIAVLALPPIDRNSGAFYAAWAAMIVQRVVPQLRLIVPENGPEVARIERLFRSCARIECLRRCGNEIPLAELLIAADHATYVPTSPVSTFAVAWAMAAGRSIVASAIPVVSEVLSHGVNARLCHPGSPRDAARRLLESVEQVDASRRLAMLAQSHAYAIFSRQRMIEQFARVYRNLAEGRPAADGIVDAAIQPQALPIG
jgi:glycosyltransferase involved in cell wall biosynthesis